MPSHSQMLSSAKMLLYYWNEGGILSFEQEQSLTNTDYKAYFHATRGAEDEDEQMERGYSLADYAEAQIKHLEGYGSDTEDESESDDESKSDDEPPSLDTTKPKSVLKGKVIPLAKQSQWQRIWGDWCKKVNAENTKAITAYKAERKAETGSANGAHLKWINIHKGKDSKEFKEFQAKHPAYKA